MKNLINADQTPEAAARESRADAGLTQNTDQAIAYETGFLAGAAWAEGRVLRGEIKVLGLTISQIEYLKKFYESRSGDYCESIGIHE